MSVVRKKYFFKFFCRILIFIGCFVMCFNPDNFIILEGFNFFEEFHILHVLWVIWMFDMLLQIIPVKNTIALGSQKLFKIRFQPIREKINLNAFKKHIALITASAYKVFLIWTFLIIILGLLFHFDVIDEIWLFMFSVFFYVCDLICVLIWCPFRLLMRNKCCTTCRIFNWDHLMMFSPLIFVGGFFSISLVVMAFLVWLVWELCFFIYPERFCEMTNDALKCNKCTDKLCTQYCQKRSRKLI